MPTRRDFIKLLGLWGSAVLVPFERLRQAKSLSSGRAAGTQPGGDYFAGFVLLSEGEAVPSAVKMPDSPMPIVCGISREPTAVTESFTTVKELADRVYFPLYTVDSPSDWLRLGGSALLSHRDTGEVYSASVWYETYDPGYSYWVTNVHIEAFPDFPRPFPLWQSDSVVPEDRRVVLEKVDFLPAPGIRIATPYSYSCHWIFRDVLYVLVSDHVPSRERLDDLLPSIKLFGQPE